MRECRCQANSQLLQASLVPPLPPRRHQDHPEDLTDVKSSGWLAQAASPAGSVTALVAWQPSRTTAFALSDILAGTYDSHINSWADYFFTFPCPVVVRWGHEMNGTFSKWNPGYPDNTSTVAGISTTGNPTTITTAAANTLTTGQTVMITGTSTIPDGHFDVTVVDTTHFTIAISNTTTWTSGGSVKWSKTTKNAAEFQQAWQYMVNKVAARAVATAMTNNVKWFFCMNSADSPSTGVPVESFYPGNTFVDIVGFDNYNTLNGTYMTPLQTMQGFTNNSQANAYTRCVAMATNNQPVWIGEMNCVDVNDAKDTTNTAIGHSKGDWYTTLFAQDVASLPRLEAINFFDSPGTRNTWPFDSTTAAFSAFKSAFVTGTYTPAPAPTPVSGQPPAWTGYTLPGPESHVGVMNPDGSINPLARSLGGEISALWHYLNQVTQLVGGWNALSGISDGSLPAGAFTASAVGTVAQPIVSIVPASNSLKSAFAIQISGDSVPTLQINQDGSLRFSPGGSTASDVRITRSGTSTLTVDQYFTVGTGLTANAFTGMVQNIVNDTGNTLKPAAGAGVKLRVVNDSLYVLNPGKGAFLVRPSYGDPNLRYGPVDPALANSTFTLAIGVMFLSKVWLGEAKTITKTGLNVTVGGTGLVNCFQGVYDTNGNLLGSTSDLSSSLATPNAYYSTLTAASGQTLALEPNYYFVATLIGTGTTTSPTVSGVNNGLPNWGNITASLARALSYGSSQTSLPTSITLGSAGLQTKIVYQDIY